MLVLVLLGPAAVGCSAGGGGAGPEATGSGSAAVPVQTVAAQEAAAGPAVADAGSEDDAAAGGAMSAEDAQAALVEAGLAADAGETASDGEAGESAGTAPRVDAASQTLFDGICAVCHGDDGTGRIGLDLTISTLTPEEVRDVLLYGRPETQMAGFAEILSESEIDSLVAFVASLRRRG